MSASHDISIVDYYAEHSGYRCGYCKSPNTNYSHGMWAHSLTVEDYQDLIDRGWRRSGCYCYKPTMHLTCCPMYTIRCSAMDFKLSKSQKKKLKRFHNFLAYGKKRSVDGDDDTNESASDFESPDEAAADCGMNEIPGLKEKAEKAQLNVRNAVVDSAEPSFRQRLSVNEDKNKTTSANEDTRNTNLDGQHSETKSEKTSIPSVSSVVVRENLQGKKEESTKSPSKKGARPGEGMDPNRPMCKKAKLLRKEKKEKRLALIGLLPVDSPMTKTPPTAKSLEDYINESLPEAPAHRLEIRLVRSHPVSHEFTATFKAAFDVYQRYQMTIHNDPIEKVNEKQFTRFLVHSPLKIKLVMNKSAEMSKTLETSWALFVKYQMAIHREEQHECDMTTYIDFLVQTPLKPWMPKDGPPQGYGSFHQQYWLDGRLIAVGVLDILPSCVSSVYFFYDPEFHFLVLGTYGSLREIAFCRSLHHSAPSLRYYYMGFYIHSCPKMRYKGTYSPSFLLCPEVYTWHSIEYCIPLLEKHKYSRFNGDPEAKDVEQVGSVNHVSVLFHNRAMSYHHYLSLDPSCEHSDDVAQYANLVGNKLSRRMLLLVT